MLSEGIKKGERLNAFAFLYFCLKDVDKTFLFLLVHFYQVSFSSGFGLMRTSFKIMVIIPYSRRNLSMPSCVTKYINLHIT